MTIKNLLSIAVMVWILLPGVLFGQYEKEWFKQLDEEDQKQIEALAMYPGETRLAILEAAQAPHALIKLKRIQEKTSESFNQLIGQYPRDDQQAIWDLVRYPGLVDQLAGASRRTRKAVLENYPEQIHNRANDIAKRYPDLLIAISNLQADSQQTFDRVISQHPPKTEDALEHLLELPEVLTILTDNIEMTMMIGDLYKDQPEWVMQKADSLNLVLAREQAQELEDWKAEIQNNPEVAEDMQASAKDFADEYEYDDAYYDYDTYEEDYETRVVEHHYYHHYPYWFGSPTWYAYPRWRPLPWWYEWGFYARPGHGVFIIGMPSYFSLNWYFNHGHHHYHHPHFSAHVVNHYYGHRHSTGSVTHVVRHWQTENSDIVTEQWLAKKEHRVERMKEFGKFEKDRKTYNDQNVKRPLSKTKYLAENSKAYPNLNAEKEQVKLAHSKKDKVLTKPDSRPKDKVLKSKKRPKTKKKSDPVFKRPDKKKSEPKVKTKKQKPEIYKPRPKVKEKPSKPKTKKPSIPKVKKARDYHKNKWQKPKAPTVKKRTPSVKQSKPRPKVRTKKKPKVKGKN